MNTYVAQVNPIAFRLFGLEIHWYAIIIVTGIILAVRLSSKEAVRVGLKEDDVIDLMFWALPLSILGARIYYVLFEWEYFSQYPSQIFAIRNGGLAIYGGLIVGGIVTYVFTYYRLIPFWKFLDIAAPSVMIAQAIGRWGNFMNHEAFGPETTRHFLEKLQLPNFIIDNMYIEGAYRQPTFLYESMWNLIGFALLLWLRNKPKWLKEGEVALLYVMWYSFGRFFIEGMRTDSLWLFGVVRVSQLLSLLLFIGAGIFWWYRRKYVAPPYYDRKQGDV